MATPTPSQLVSDLFNIYRSVAPAIFVTWAFINAKPLLAVQFGLAPGTVDWFTAVVQPATTAQLAQAEQAGTKLLGCAVANWVLDAALRKLVFWHKSIPWDFVVHHLFSIGLALAVTFLGKGYGYMYLALLAESYAFVVFASQLSFLKPACQSA